MKTLCFLFVVVLTGCVQPSSLSVAPPFSGRLYYMKEYGGADLLNPNTVGHFNKDSITVSDLVMTNGTMKEMAQFTNCGYSYVCPPWGTGYFCISITYDQRDLSRKGTLIHLGHSRVDTLLYETGPIKNYSGIGVTKVLYKGKTILDTSYMPHDEITITR